MTKELIVVGGANGAGKTTFADEYVALHGVTYISADAIALELSPDDPTSARVAAGRQFLQRIRWALSESESFVIESTLSGRTFRRVLLDAKRSGFAIAIVYIFLDSADACVDRVRMRVEAGGHDVLEGDVRRRFSRSVLNFWNLYRSLSDTWVLMYNSGSDAQDVAIGAGDEVSIRDLELYKRFLQLIAVP